MRLWEVLPEFYIRGHTKDVNIEDINETLKKYNIQHIVCLVARADDRLIEDERYEVFPISDGKEVPMARANWIVDSITDYLDLNEPTIVHCHAGRNRTGLISALTVKRFRPSWSGEQIFTHLKTIRPNILANPHYEEFVRSIQ